MTSTLQRSHATRSALRAEYEDNEEGAEVVHGPVPPDCAHAPPHDAVADEELTIVRHGCVNYCSKSDGDFGVGDLTHVDTEGDGHHP